MHEIALCQSILKTLETELTRQQLNGLREIHMKIGILSGVEPMFLRHAYDFVAADSPFQNTRLCIETVDVVAGCEHCGRPFAVKNYIFVCPDCHNPSDKVIAGREMEIHKLLIETETPVPNSEAAQ